MQYIILFLFVCLSGNVGYCQKGHTKILGTVSISDSSYIDVTEVTIQEYLYFIVNNHFDEALFPDEQKLSSTAHLFFKDIRTGSKSLYITIIKNHPVIAASYGDKGLKVTTAYNKFISSDTTGFSIYNPIVGITYEQALRFCAWRQENENKNRMVKVKISLPSVAVYRYVNENIDSFNIANSFRYECLKYRYNFAHDPCKFKGKNRELIVSGTSLVRADSFEPNSKNLYNIQGNAAEMTSTKGVAVGGSFRHPAKASMSDQIQNYISSEDWLGFRCYVTFEKGE